MTILIIFSSSELFGQTSEIEKTNELINPFYFTATFSNIHGTIKRFKLSKEQYYQKEKEFFSGAPEYLFVRGPMEIVTTWDPEYYPFRIDFKQLDIKSKVQRVLKTVSKGSVKEGTFEEIYRNDPVWTVVKRTFREIVYVFPDPKTDISPIFIEKRYVISGHYSILMTVTIYNFSSEEIREQILMTLNAWQPPNIKEGSFLGPIPDNKKGACHVGGSMEWVEVKDMLGNEKSFPQLAEWGGIDSRYFIMAGIAPSSMNPQCSTIAYQNGVIQTKIHETNINIVSPATNFCIPDWMSFTSNLTKCSDDFKTLNLK